MAPPRLRLLAGVSVNRAIEVLDSLVALAADLNNWMAPSHPADLLRDQYLNWAESVEQQLLTLTLDQDALHTLFTDRYWHIRAVADPRPVPLVRGERDEQVATLKRWTEDLRLRKQRLAPTGGQTAVLDTNVLLQFQPPDQILWPEVLGVPDVRLVVPLRAVEELDMKKYARNENLARRARDVLPRLERNIGRAGEPGELRSGVTIEVLIEPAPRFRPQDADEEILNVCVELVHYGGDTPRLVTADSSMRLRAAAVGIEVVSMPDRYLRKPAQAGEHKGLA